MSAPLLVIDARSVGKVTTAENLITVVIANGWSLVIVKTTPSIKNRLIKGPIFLAGCGTSLLYAVTDISSLAAGVKCLSTMRLWHKPVFHALIVPKGTEKQIARICVDGGKKILDIERVIERDILCYVDPVDDQLEFYGNETAVSTISSAFPSQGD